MMLVLINLLMNTKFGDEEAFERMLEEYNWFENAASDVKTLLDVLLVLLVTDSRKQALIARQAPTKVIQEACREFVRCIRMPDKFEDEGYSDLFELALRGIL